MLYTLTTISKSNIKQYDMHHDVKSFSLHWIFKSWSCGVMTICSHVVRYLCFRGPSYLGTDIEWSTRGDRVLSGPIDSRRGCCPFQGHYRKYKRGLSHIQAIRKWGRMVPLLQPLWGIKEKV